MEQFYILGHRWYGILTHYPCGDFPFTLSIFPESTHERVEFVEFQTALEVDQYIDQYDSIYSEFPELEPDWDFGEEQ